MQAKGRYLLNLKSGKIHDGKNLCSQGSRIAEENRKWSDSFEELVDFFEGGKKGVACGICCKYEKNRKRRN